VNNLNVGLAKRTLIAAIKAAPAFAHITVDYAYSGISAGGTRTYIYGGRTTVEQNYAAMTSGTKPRDRKFTVDLHLLVDIPGGAVTDSDDAALTLLDTIDALLAADVTMGGMAGLRYAGITGFDMTYALDDDEVETEIVAHVGFSTRLF
jgi:hypothetical protein